MVIFFFLLAMSCLIPFYPHVGLCPLLSVFSFLPDVSTLPYSLLFRQPFDCLYSLLRCPLIPVVYVVALTWLCVYFCVFVN